MVATNIIALRYGQSAFVAALQLGKEDQALKDLSRILSFLKAKGQGVMLATSIRVPARVKSQVWEKYFESYKFEKFTTNLISLLIRNNRLNALAEIIGVFHEEHNKHSGVKKIEVISAVELDEALKSEITNAMAAALKAKIELDCKVDAAIIGGILVRVGSEQLDFSIGAKLSKIKQKLVVKN